MTLSRRMVLQLGVLWAITALVGVAAVWGIGGLRQDLTTSLRLYDQLHAVYEAGLPVAQARQMVRSNQEASPNASDMLRLVLERAQVQAHALQRLPTPDVMAEAERAAALESLDRALANAAAAIGQPREVEMHLNAALNQLAGLGQLSRDGIERVEANAQHRHQTTLVIVAVTAAVMLLAVVVTGIRQYRAVMLPLDAIRRNARQLAARRFDQPVPEQGDQEFVAVAREINSMAAQLQQLYADLESQVAQKTQQLARSEKLASLGQLAAGVAHEVNNPLHIISSHAELLLRRMDRLCPDAPEELVDALATIADQTLRCKQITEALLSLSRAGGPREPLDFAAVLQRAVHQAQQLPQSQGHRIVLEADESANARVLGNERELTQVLLNLLVNACEAMADGQSDGGVRVTLSCEATRVAVAIADDGCGMAADQRERVFEPFYTHKRGVNQAGTGLGLSIASTIISEHGGSVTAFSEGAGCGSVFTIHLPRLSSEPDDA